MDAGVVEAVEQVAEEAAGLEGGGGDVVEDRDVGELAGRELAALFGEAAGGDLGVVAEQHVAGFAERDARIGEGRALEEVGDAGGGDHVRGHAVGAEAEQDALLQQRQHLLRADGVVHVGFRIVDHHGAGLGDEVHFRFVEMDAVDEERVFPGQAELVQALDDARAVLGDAVGFVGEILGDVDMDAGLGLGADARGGFEGGVGEGHLRVEAEERGDLAVLGGLGFLDEAGIFGDAVGGDVAVGGLVAQAAGEAGLAEGFLHDVERAVGAGRGGVVVDDGGAAGVDGFEEGDEGGVADGLGVEGEVELPPHALEDFDEIAGGFAGGGEAAGEGGVEVVVGVDEAGHGDHALGVHDLCADGHLDGRADGGDFGAFDEDFALGEDGAGVVEGDDQGVLDQQGGHASLRVGFFHGAEKGFPRQEPQFSTFSGRGTRFSPGRGPSRRRRGRRRRRGPAGRGRRRPPGRSGRRAGAWRAGRPRRGA